MNFNKKSWEEMAFDLAEKGISLGTKDQLKASTLCWAAAAALAVQHLKDTDIYYWIMSGYGRSLLEGKRYDEAIEIAKLAYEWELARQQPLSTLTLAHALLAQGNRDAAKPFFQASYALIGEEIYKQFPELKIETFMTLLQDQE